MKVFQPHEEVVEQGVDVEWRQCHVLENIQRAIVLQGGGLKMRAAAFRLWCRELSLVESFLKSWLEGGH